MSKKQAGKKPKKMTTAQILTGMASSDPFLGNARAVVIVCLCANSAPANLGRKLSELGVQGGPFQACVFKGVATAGYTVSINAIPNGPDTLLIEVVNVIQHAPRTV